MIYFFISIPSPSQKFPSASIMTSKTPTRLSRNASLPLDDVL
jgi:hypothetical protein